MPTAPTGTPTGPPSSFTLVIPVFNEEAQVVGSVKEVRHALAGLCAWNTELVVADNGSTDGTWGLVQGLEQRGWIRALRLGRPGRGAALRQAWLSSRSDVVGYLDVDLSTDLRHLAELVEPFRAGQADLVVGSRLLPDSVVTRGWRREVLSRGFNRLAGAVAGSRVRDHQCGFKALLRTVAVQLLPQVVNDRWFFDTELLVLAQRQGFRIHEVPVRWRDDPDSRVRLIPTVVEDLRGLLRLRQSGGGVDRPEMDVGTRSDP